MEIDGAGRLTGQFGVKQRPGTFAAALFLGLDPAAHRSKAVKRKRTPTRHEN